MIGSVTPPPVFHPPYCSCTSCMQPVTDPSHQHLQAGLLSQPPAVQIGRIIFIEPTETPEEKRAKEIERMWEAVKAAGSL